MDQLSLRRCVVVLTVAAQGVLGLVISGMVAEIVRNSAKRRSGAYAHVVYRRGSDVPVMSNVLHILWPAIFCMPAVGCGNISP